jgi:hypothetical protein
VGTLKALMRFGYAPVRSWAEGAERINEHERNRWQEALVRTAAAADSRLYELFGVLMLIGLPTAALLWANSCGFSAPIQVLVALVGGFIGWVPVPSIWTVVTAIHSPVLQCEKARIALSAERERSEELELRRQLAQYVRRADTLVPEARRLRRDLPAIEGDPSGLQTFEVAVRGWADMTRYVLEQAGCVEQAARIDLPEPPLEGSAIDRFNQLEAQLVERRVLVERWVELGMGAD